MKSAFSFIRSLSSKMNIPRDVQVRFIVTMINNNK